MLYEGFKIDDISPVFLAIEADRKMLFLHFLRLDQCECFKKLIQSSIPAGEGQHGFGSLIRGGWGSRCTFHHNLFAHHNGRSPRPGNYIVWNYDPIGLLFDFRNNVIYDWGYWAGYAGSGNEKEVEFTKLNYVGNYLKPGPSTKKTFAERRRAGILRTAFKV